MKAPNPNRAIFTDYRYYRYFIKENKIYVFIYTFITIAYNSTQYKQVYYNIYTFIYIYDLARDHEAKRNV